MTVKNFTGNTLRARVLMAMDRVGTGATGQHSRAWPKIIIMVVTATLVYCYAEIQVLHAQVSDIKQEQSRRTPMVYRGD